MSLDERLTAALRDVADNHEPSGPDVARIVHGGRRRRRTRDVRRAVVAGAAVLAVGAATPFVLGAGGDQPPRPAAPVHDPVTELPVGDAPAIPYCAGDRTIRGAGGPIHAPCDVMVHRGDSTLLLSRRGVEVLHDGQRQLLGRRGPSYWFPAVSRDGHYAAWVAKAPHTETGAELFVHDLHHAGGHTAVPWPTTEGWVPGIDDRGRVYFEEFGGGVSYFDIGSGATVPVGGLAARVIDGSRVRFVTADGFGLGVQANSRNAVVGVVTDGGRFSQQQVVTQGSSFYSPDGARFVHATADGLAVGSTNSEEQVLLDLPEPGSPTWYPMWESDDSLLVQFDPDSAAATTELGYGLNVPARRTYLLRCDAGSGDCEVALEPGWGDRMTAPVYR